MLMTKSIFEWVLKVILIHRNALILAFYEIAKISFLSSFKSWLFVHNHYTKSHQFFSLLVLLTVATLLSPLVVNLESLLPLSFKLTDLINLMTSFTRSLVITKGFKLELLHLNRGNVKTTISDIQAGTCWRIKDELTTRL